MTSFALSLGVTGPMRTSLPVTPLSIPSGFGWTPSWTFSRIGAGASSTFACSFNFDSSKPTPNADIYVDSIAGNNANAGTSRGAAVRSLSTAITKANALGVAVVRLLVRPGDFWRYAGSTLNDHFNATQQTCDLIIERDTFYATAPINVIGNHAAAVSYALFSGSIYKATASVGTSSGRNLIDRANLDADGLPVGLKRIGAPANTADPSAEINAAHAAYGRGAYYYNAANGDLFVRTVDSRAPDSSIVLLSGASGNFTMGGATARKTWMDGLTLIGGDRPVAIGLTVANSEFYGRDCAFLAAVNNLTGSGGFSWVTSAGTAVLLRCKSHYSNLDGFNYHGGSTGGSNSPKALEIDCVSRHCGDLLGGSNNASTAHEDSIVISVNGTYATAIDRVIHDINAAQRWMLGSTINAPVDTSSASGLLRSGNGAAEATKHWLDAVRFGAISGSQFHIDALAAAQVKYANMDATGWVLPGAGSVASYTP